MQQPRRGSAASGVQIHFSRFHAPYELIETGVVAEIVEHGINCIKRREQRAFGKIFFQPRQRFLVLAKRSMNDGQTHLRHIANCGPGDRDSRPQR